MECYHSIIRFLTFVNSLVAFGQCADELEEPFQFEIELVARMVEYTDHVAKEGPLMPKNHSISNRLCAAALNYISSEFQEPPTYECMPTCWPEWRFPEYPDKPRGNRGYVHSLYCGTILRKIYVRATDNPDNTFIIMIGQFSRFASAHGFYGMNEREYLFTVKLTDGNPVQNRGNNESGMETLLSTIENDALREVYEKMKLLDWIFICLKAKHHIRDHSSIAEPITQHSPVGYRFLKLYNYGHNQSEERVGYQCPMTPLTYVYLEDAKTAGIVLITKA